MLDESIKRCRSGLGGLFWGRYTARINKPYAATVFVIQASVSSGESGLLSYRCHLLTYVTQAWRKIGSPTFLFLSSRLAVAA